MAGLAALLLAASAQAANFSLWINGRTGGGQAGNYGDFTYWGPASTPAGVNKKAVNWDGYHHIADQNYLVRNALDCFCTGSNWCYVAAHSAGDLMMGYTLAMYGGTSRPVTNASPAADGSCSPTTGATQVGWNIRWVDISAGAAGGSELANSGDWALSEPLVSDLKTGTARAMYNHGDTRGLAFSMYAGASGTLYSFVLPGQDDEVVAYHSSGGVSGNSGASYCNPSDWFCNDLTLGTAKVEGGRAKWANHSVVFRDNAERYDHYTRNNWGGVTSLVREDMVARALATSATPSAALDAATAARQLAKLRQARETYRRATAYPPGSRPLAEQADQADPAAPIVELLPLRHPGAPVNPQVLLRSSQQRVYVQGQESVRISLSAQDDRGQRLPLQVEAAHVQEGATGDRAGRLAEVPVSFAERNGEWVAVLRPGPLGYAEFEGLVRLKVSLRSGLQAGSAHFDIIHTAKAQAAWTGAVQDSVDAGSLVFHLPLQVQQAGRYLASGRVFDADGQPVALASFNGELGTGWQSVRLQVFGKLLRDLRPRFPLVLKDVQAFQLLPDRFPDRALLPMRAGPVHTTAAYGLQVFSEDEWQSDERSRHLAAHDRAVSQAEAHVLRLGAGR